MRVVVLVVVVIVAAAAAFALGRTTASNPAPEAPTATDGRDITGRIGDQLRVPSVELLCLIDVEVNGPRLLCNHTGKRSRYQVIFERDRTLVGRIGDPGNQRIFPER